MIEIVNIMKVIDIDVDAVSPETVEFLETNCVTYRDQLLREHLVNIGDAIEEIEDEMDGELPAKTVEEIYQLQKLAGANNSGYVRFVRS